MKTENEALEAGRKVVLRTIYNHTKDFKPNQYISTSALAELTPNSPSYGLIKCQDIPKLLEPHVLSGLVRKVTITGKYGNSPRAGYAIPTDKRKRARLEKILERG